MNDPHIRRSRVKQKRRPRIWWCLWFVMSLFHFLPLQHGDNTVGIRQTSSHRLVWTGSESARSRAHCRLHALVHTTLRAPSPRPRPLLKLEPSWLVTMVATRPHLPRAVWAIGNFTCCDWLVPLQTSYFGAGPANGARARVEVEL